MKVNDIIQEGVLSKLGTAFAGDTNVRARQARAQQRDLERQQADQIANPPIEPAPLNPLSQTNPARQAQAPVGYHIQLSPENSVTKTKDGWRHDSTGYLIPTNMPAHRDYENFAKDGIHSYKDVETTTPTSKFLQQFEIIDDSPVTIQWKNQQFQRKGNTGDWVTFPGGKPAPEQMSAALDKVSPLPKAPAKPPKPIAVKDNAGVVWTKDETTKTWKSTSGVVATPVNAKELEKRALPQYQARQMGV